MQFLYFVLKIQRTWLIKINYYIFGKGKVTLKKENIFDFSTNLHNGGKLDLIKFRNIQFWQKSDF